LLTGGFDRLESSLRGVGDDPAGPAARRWLGLARWLGPRLRDHLRPLVATIVPLQPCLRDARPEHFLFEGDHVTGLVDYGAMGVECVAADLARLLAEFSAWTDDHTSYGEALDGYTRVRTLTLDECRLLVPFAQASALLAGAHWVRWHFVEGRTFEPPGAVERGIGLSVDRLAGLAARGVTR
jgi:Ser/Thr protein kinase RdoA (MazF antagonist)